MIATTLGPLASAGVRADGEESHRLDFGLVGIAHGQIARLNVVAPLGPDAPPIRARLLFLDSSGHQAVNGDGVPIASDVTLDPGRAAFLDLRASDVLTSDAGRQFRAVIAPQPPPIRIGATLELIDDASGITTFVVPQPPPIETVRLTEPTPDPSDSLPNQRGPRVLR